MNETRSKTRVLRLAVDAIPAKARLELPASPRFVFVRDGDAIVRSAGSSASLGAGSGSLLDAPLDREYLNEWAGRLNLADALKEAEHE